MFMESREHLRLKRELKDIENENDSTVEAYVVDNNIFKWRGNILGPPGTPYEGGRFVLDINIPHDYPYSPPVIKFETKIWHPNISSETGAICLDILKSEWSPALTIRTALISIQALLSAPEPDDPQDAQVANMYKKDYEEFERTAKDNNETKEGKVGSWTKQIFQIKTLMEIGIEREIAKKALEENGWDTTVAINRLMDS